MIERTPDGNRDSQGQMDFNSNENRTACLSRPGIISYTSDVLSDTLCVVGFPNATVYAKSNPGGASEGDSTDTDFFVRVLDVYPDGREFFVVEGAVNARGRDYARNLLEHPEMDTEFPYPNDKTPFTNIETGKIYEYKFQMFPIAYTWGKGHRMKVLISSSNFDRFQVNPNIPIQAGEFFRRKPGDGQTYTFNGVEYAPRVAVQRVAFSTDHPTHISLPVYSQQYVGTEEEEQSYQASLGALVYPNPSAGAFTVYMSHQSDYKVSLLDIAGKTLLNTRFSGEKLDLSLQGYSSGMYFISIQDKQSGEHWVEKLQLKN
jgi:hypothetical protein